MLPRRVPVGPHAQYVGFSVFNFCRSVAFAWIFVCISLVIKSLGALFAAYLALCISFMNSLFTVFAHFLSCLVEFYEFFVHYEYVLSDMLPIFPSVEKRKFLILMKSSLSFILRFVLFVP